MRAVSSATWTSGDPVSFSPRPNLLDHLLLCLFGQWHGGKRSRLTRRSALPPTIRRLLHVLCIWAMSSSAESKRSSSRRRSRNSSRIVSAVEVALEPDQVRLDPLVAPRLECGPHADADRRGPAPVAPSTGGVDAGRRARPGRGGGSRFAVGIPSSRPRASPSTTVPSSTNGPPSSSRPRRDRARRDQVADPARGHGLAAALDQRHDRRLELGVRRAGSRRRRRRRARTGSSPPRSRAARPRRPVQHVPAELPRRSTIESSCVNGITIISSMPSAPIRPA